MTILGGTAVGPYAGIAGLCAAGATICLTAWGQFCLARLVLAACHGTPLRLMAALRDAHGRGVLRKAGGVHQFRHNLLHDHLARE